jgi:hypothetical protein
MVTVESAFRLMKHAMLRMVGYVVLGVALSQLTPARAEPQDQSAGSASGVTTKAATAEARPRETRPSTDEICRALAQAATNNALPEEFFTRLIWQESRFDPAAISPAGAQGIAQFMPQTAVTRGVADAFEPLQALRESASYLRELRATFRGSLGLAAAAYNAGPGQVEAWLAGRSSLPSETLVYVRTITGYSAEAWASQPLPQLELSNTPTGARCIELARAMIENGHRRLAPPSSQSWEPWTIQLAVDGSEGGARASYERLRRKYSAILGNRLPLILYTGSTFVVRVPGRSRADADARCAQLRAAGVACTLSPHRPNAINAAFQKSSTGSVATLGLSGHALKPRRSCGTDGC